MKKADETESMSNSAPTAFNTEEQQHYAELFQALVHAVRHGQIGVIGHTDAMTGKPCAIIFAGDDAGGMPVARLLSEGEMAEVIAAIRKNRGA